MAAGGRSAVVFLLIELGILVPYIVAFALDNWMIVVEDGIIESTLRANVGLWWGCGYDHDLAFQNEEDKVCFSMLEAGVPAWLRAVQAFAILGIFFGVVCVILTMVMVCGRCDNDMMFKLFLPVWYLAGFSMLLAIVIFAVSMSTFENVVPVLKHGIEIWSSVVIQKFWTGFIIESIAACVWNAFGCVFLCAICCT